MSASRLACLGLGAALLAGCGSGPGDQRRADVAALTEAANGRDAGEVRDRADALLTTVERQREREQLTAEEADRLVALVQAVRKSADAIDLDLLERRRAEAEAKARAAEQARQQLEQERKKAEEEARKAERGRDEDDDD